MKVTLSFLSYKVREFQAESTQVGDPFLTLWVKLYCLTSNCPLDEKDTQWKCGMMNICTGQQQRLSSVAKRLVSCVQPSAQVMLGGVISWAPDNRDLTMGPLLMDEEKGRQRMGWFGSITDSMDVCLCAKLQRVRHDWSDCSLPGCFVHGIPQARTLEWVAIPTSGSNLRFMSPALAGRFFTASTPWEAPNEYELSKFQEVRKDRGAWCAVVYGVAKSRT